MAEQDVLDAIENLKELTETKIDSLNLRLDDAIEDIDRNQDAIRQLYDLNRAGSDKLKEVNGRVRDNTHLIQELDGKSDERLGKNIRKLMWAVIISIGTAAGASIWQLVSHLNGG